MMMMMMMLTVLALLGCSTDVAAQHPGVPGTMRKVTVAGKCTAPDFTCVKAVPSKTPRPTLGTVL